VLNVPEAAKPLSLSSFCENSILISLFFPSRALLGFNPNPLQVGSNPDSSTPPLEAVLLELLFSTVRVSKPLANTFQVREVRVLGFK